MLETAGPRQAGSAQKAPGWHDLSPLISSDCSPFSLSSLSLWGGCRLISYPAAITGHSQTSKDAGISPTSSPHHTPVHISHTRLCISVSYISVSYSAHREVKHAVLLINTHVYKGSIGTNMHRHQVLILADGPIRIYPSPFHKEEQMG